MHEMYAGVISGLIANALTSLIMQFGERLPFFRGGRDPVNLIIEDDALTQIIGEATDALSRIVEAEGNSEEKVLAFFQSAEVVSIVRTLLGVRILDLSQATSISEIQEQFILSYRLHVTQDNGESIEGATQLFHRLIELVGKALDNAIEREILSAHEAKSSVRHLVLVDELKQISAKLEYLSHRTSLEVSQILEFQQKYCLQVRQRYETITPPHFDSAQRFPIDDLYVAPTLQQDDSLFKTHRDLDIDRFVSCIYRTVLLGNPGNGKSTLAFKLAHDLAARMTDHSLQQTYLPKAVPIVVILREYGAEKQAKGWSILEFIEGRCNSHLQIQPPIGAFEYLLKTGSAFLIFDGLDELLDTSYRQEVSRDVESFANLYPTCPIFVTSRAVGYEQAPLDSRRFQRFHIAPFNDNQVESYVRKSFRLERDLPEPQRDQQIAAFLQESSFVPDLRSNPLMLALMCSIYRGEGYLPKNRPDVYEKCAVMLFERWDKSRNIRVSLPFEYHLRPAMMYLAHWIYEDKALQSGVTETDLIKRTTEYLHPRRYDDVDEAREAAREFIGICRGRAWVFTDTGTTPDGDRLYQFTHRTFLEYFAAAHLVRTNPIPGQLLDIIRPKVLRREWDVVAQLSFQIQGRNTEGATDDLLAGLLAQLDTVSMTRRWYLLSFVVRSLEFLVPSPTITRRLVDSFMTQLTEWALALFEASKQGKKRRQLRGLNPVEVLEALGGATDENRSPIEEVFGNHILRLVEAQNVDQRILGLGLLLFPMHRRKNSRIFDADYTSQLFNRVDTAFQEVARLRVEIAAEAYTRGFINAHEFLNISGIDGFFSEIEYSLVPEYYAVPVFYHALVQSTQYISGHIEDEFRNSIEGNLSAFASSLVNCNGPMTTRGPNKFTMYGITHILRLYDMTHLANLPATSEALFLIFVSLAMTAEKELASRKRRPRELFPWSQHVADTSPLRFLTTLCHARLRNETMRVESAIAELKLQSPYADVVQSWTRGERSFLSSDGLKPLQQQA